MTEVHNRQAVPATSAGWIAFSTESRILAVGASPNDVFVTALWEAIGTSDGLQRTLDLVTSKGLSATPPFALVDLTDGLRVIVRGGVTVDVTTASGVESLSGVGVSTWIERSIDGATAVSLTVDGAVAAGVPALPLVAGAAWIQSLAVGIGASVAAAVPGQEPAVAVAPAATPPVDVPPVDVPPAVVEAAAADSAAGSAAAGSAAAGSSAASTSSSVEIDIEATVTEAPTESLDTPTVAIDNLETSPEGYDYLFGDTMYRSVADAAVRDDEPEADEAPAEPSAGDHDGHTVLTSDIAKLRGRRKPKAAPDVQPAAPEAPVVSLVLADGSREPLTQPILVGRSPSVTQVSGGKMPKLITAGGADQDISRNHVRFVLEGGTVVVTDLHSRNGTTIAMPGKDPQKLRAGEPTSVIVGTVVDLGGGVTFTVDEA